MPTTGHVTQLWRYPVKSMLGEQLDSLEIGPLGATGDRAFAVIDVETGKVASAKQPRKWAAMLTLAATLDADGRPQITTPSGDEISGDDRAIGAALSRILGREVALSSKAEDKARYDVYRPAIAELGGESEYESTLASGAPGTFFDFGPVHLIAENSLEHLRTSAAASDFDVRRFRPNVVVRMDGDAAPYIENGWAKVDLTLGPQVAIRGVIPAPRCVMTTLAQRGLPPGDNVLRTLARENLLDFGGTYGKMACLGLYASVAAPGAVKVGDRVTVLGAGA